MNQKVEGVAAYPLTWPSGWPRAKTRTRANFNTKGVMSQATRPLSVNDGLQRVFGELGRMGIRDYSVIVSTNIETTLRGIPRSDRREPLDPGVAVYFTNTTVRGEPKQCIAIDRYDRVADNLAAIAATVEALRAIERHGGAEILNRAFTGFTALPGPVAGAPWWHELGVDRRAPHEDVLRAYQRARSKGHPDNGGDPVTFQRISDAWSAYNQERFGTQP